MARVARKAAIVLAVAVLACGVAGAAGPYDGKWTGGAEPSGAKCKATAITIEITNGQATGTTERAVGGSGVTGAVAQDGSFDGRVGSAHLVGKFSGDAFDGSYGSPECGARHVKLSRSR
jgi:hypothetical protein